jgi:hypothetical protein
MLMMMTTMTTMMTRTDLEVNEEIELVQKVVVEQQDLLVQSQNRLHQIPLLLLVMLLLTD